MPVYVVQFDFTLQERLEKVLREQNFQFSHPPHTVFQAKGDKVSLTLYQSGKLLVQGKEMESFIKFTLEPEVLGSFTYGYEHIDATPHIGVDESGKGDFFGPLVIAGVHACEKGLAQLKKIEARDSKTVKDPQIHKMAREIEKCCSHALVILKPERYNTFYAQVGNLNTLLGWGHATVIEKLMQETGCRDVVIDKFAADHVVANALKKKNLSPNLEQITQGEKDIVVAAASILARSAFVNALEKLSKEWNMPFPKGVSKKTHSIGKSFIEKHGKEKLPLVGKMHFKTAQEILE